MHFGKYLGFFLVSTVKFMFAPFGGPGAHMGFFETYFVCIAGALFSAAFFYFMSEFFMKRAHDKRARIRHAAAERGMPLPEKKKFTKVNKFIIRTKRSFGIYGIAMYAPFFFSVPIGSIIAAKFYGSDRRTFPLIVLGMFVNGMITTGLAYLIYSFF